MTKQIRGYTFFLLGLFLGQLASADEMVEKVDSRVKFNPIKDFAEFNLDNYTRWPWLTGYEYSGLHWNQFVSIYSNRGADVYKNNYSIYLQEFLDDDEDILELSAQERGYKLYHEGTVIIKENYADLHGKPGTLLSLTVMVKRHQGFDAQAGNWEYLKFDSGGKMLFRGSSEQSMVKASCASCHLNVAERDHVFSTVYSSN